MKASIAWIGLVQVQRCLVLGILAFLLGGCGGITRSGPGGTDLPVVQETESYDRYADGAATTRVTQIHPPYGNIDTEFEVADLERLGLSQGDRFTVESTSGQRLEVTWATTYDDVPRGAGVAFPNWEGRIRIARNHENAAAALGVSEGDWLTLRRFNGSE